MLRFVTARKAAVPDGLIAAASSRVIVSPPGIAARFTANRRMLPSDHTYTPVPTSLSVADNTRLPPPAPSIEFKVVVRVGFVVAPPRTISSSAVAAR